MPIKWFSLVLLLGSVLNLHSQVSPGAKQISLANSDVALSSDVFSIFNNPAGTSQLNWRELGIYYSPAPFGLKELANGYAAYLEPTPWGNITAGFMTYGFELYRENKFLLSYSTKLDNDMFLGVSSVLNTVNIANYGSDNSLSINIGGLVWLRNNFRWGFYYHNLFRASFGNENDQIPSILSTGFSYDPVDDIIINAAIEKTTLSSLSLRFGMEYNIIAPLYLRGGFSTEPDRFTAGLAFIYSYLEVDYALFNHNNLGLTHQAGVIISFTDLANRSKRIKEYIGLLPEE